VRAPAGSKLDPFKEWICEQLQAEPTIQSQRLRELASELGYTGGKLIFDDYVCELRPRFLVRRTFQRTVYRRGELARLTDAKAHESLRIAASLGPPATVIARVASRVSERQGGGLMAATSTARKQASTPAALTCPECGRTFSRPAALGAHRKLKHGVAGISANATGNRRSGNSRGRKSATPKRRRTTTPAAQDGAAQRVNVDRDALLRTLFPSGIPPRQEVIAQVNAWLEEAERLARSR
jgi:hypothetical protein